MKRRRADGTRVLNRRTEMFENGVIGVAPTANDQRRTTYLHDAADNLILQTQFSSTDARKIVTKPVMTPSTAAGKPSRLSRSPPIAHELSIINSMTNATGNHDEPAGYMSAVPGNSDYSLNTIE